MDELQNRIYFAENYFSHLTSAKGTAKISPRESIEFHEPYKFYSRKIEFG